MKTTKKAATASNAKPVNNLLSMNVKQLTDTQKKKALIQLFKAGVVPKLIASHFKIGLSTLHKYKADLVAEGFTFPSVKGFRATSKTALTIKDVASGKYKNQNQKTKALQV